jgi:hypothetical protein
MTISMLSKWRDGTPLSIASDFTEGASCKEYESARDLECDDDMVEEAAMDVGRMSAPELESVEISGLVTRNGSKSDS